MGGLYVSERSARIDDLTHADAAWAGLRVLVTGLGVSGFAAADALLERGATVTVVDAGSATDDEAQSERARILDILGADLRIGADHVAKLPDQPIDLVVTSPGWRPTQPVLGAAAAAGIPIWGDVELAWRMRPQGDSTRWLAVTGTNGKTTTVQMLAAILQAAGLRAAAVGNVGTPVMEAVLDPQPYDALAVELSSFQLHYISTMSPFASCVLNLAPDHLDWHGSMEAYVADKARIYERTHVACVYNEQDPVTRTLVEEADVVDGCRAIGITTGVPDLSMVGVVDGLLADRAFVAERQTSAAELGSVLDLLPEDQRVDATGGGDRGEEGIPDPSAIPVAPHLVTDALAAAALARAAGVPAAAVRTGLRTFQASPHRLTDLGVRDGVRYIDDSKATNPHAATGALAAYPSTVWVAGGQLKGAEVDDLVRDAAPRLRGVVLLGQDADVFREALARHAPDVPVVSVPVDHTGHMNPTPSGVVLPRQALEGLMENVVRSAHRLAQPGDVVLLSPAAASLDMFPSYGVRGEIFAEAVQRLGKDLR